MFNNLNIMIMQEILLCAKITALMFLIAHFLVRGCQLWINFRIWREERKAPSPYFRKPPGLVFNRKTEKLESVGYGRILYLFRNFGIIDACTLSFIIGLLLSF